MAGKIKVSKADKTLPRQVYPVIVYRPKGKTNKVWSKQVNENIESFTYTDVANGESDTVSFTLANIGLYWAGKYLPKKGDTIFAYMFTSNWSKDGRREKISLGRFCCDDRGFSFPENATATIGAVSCPENRSFRSTPRTKTWENISIREMATKICAQDGLTLKYYGGWIVIAKEEQSDSDNCSFLSGLCKKYGLYTKIYDGKVLIYPVREFEKKPAAVTIDYSEVLDGDYSSTLVGTYTGAKINYTVKSGNDTSEQTVVIGTWNRMLTVSDKADSYSDALLRAKASLQEENRKAETLKLTLMGAGKKLWAGTNIKLTGAKWMNGKWFIEKATHTISASDGYSVSLELHRVK